MSGVPASTRRAEPSRRTLLTGSAVAALGGLVSGFGVGQLTAEQAAASPAAPEPALARYLSPYGRHQPGILENPQAHAVFLGIDMVLEGLEPAAKRERLRSILRMITDDAVRLMAGQGVLADTEPEMAQLPANLSLTVGLSRAAIGLIGPDLAPASLGPLPKFKIDRLREEYGQSDLVIQLCAEDPTVLAHAVRSVRKNLRSITRVKYEQHGFTHAASSQPAGSPFRNLFGQVDGIANPKDDTRRLAVFGHEPSDAWFPDATTLVLRRIQMDLDTWDEVDRPARDFALGRRQSDGAPLSGQHPQDPVDLQAVTELGLPAIAGHAHVARAMPASGDEVLWRRGYSYQEGGSAGLLFASYQVDVARSFIPVQTRLAELDALNEWTTPIGSAVYGVLPGISQGMYLGQQLFQAAGH